MARGGISIEDNVQIAVNVQLITNNHDFYNRQILLCKPIRICEGAWIGAGTSATSDVPDYAAVVGNPAKVFKMLDALKFA